MYASRNEYDRGVNTFSPEGRLFQVEYALGAVNLGATAVGIRTQKGVVLATEKRLASKLIEETSDLKKLVKIDEHVGCASAGIIADARTLVDHARLEAANHFFTFNEPMPVESCVNCVANLALDFSGVNENRKKVMSRPFGVSLIIGGVDKKAAPGGGVIYEPSLFCCDPSGSVVKYGAVAIGSAREGATQQLEQNYQPDMSLEDAKSLALLVLRQVMEDSLTSKNVEISVIEKTIRPLTDQEIQDIIDKLPAPEEWERVRGEARV